MIRKFSVLIISVIISLSGVFIALNTSTSASGNVLNTSTCNNVISSKANPPVWGESKWTSKTCNYQLRGHVRCIHSGVPAKIVNGGWVRALNIYSRATCPGPYTLQAAYSQWRVGSGHPLHTHQYYP